MSNTGAVIAPAGHGEAEGKTKTMSSRERVVIAYVCENAGRAGAVPSSGVRRRPSLPDFGWPFPVKEIAVPCAGRLQPEHFLKAFEDGADAIAVICCEEGDCHHLEGNRRCARRTDHVDGMLEQIGLGGGRLKVFHLPGSAKQDMALGLDPSAAGALQPAPEPTIVAVRDALVAHLATVSPNPMRTAAHPSPQG